MKYFIRYFNSKFPQLHINEHFTLKFFKFIVVGGSTTLLYFLLVVAGVELISMDPLMAVTISFTIIFIISFILNKTWVFGSEDTWKTTLLKFIVVSLGGFALNLGITYFLVDVLSCWYMIALLTTIVVIPFYTFSLNNFWTFSSETSLKPDFR